MDEDLRRVVLWRNLCADVSCSLGLVFIIHLFLSKYHVTRSTDLSLDHISLIVNLLLLHFNMEREPVLNVTDTRHRREAVSHLRQLRKQQVRRERDEAESEDTRITCAVRVVDICAAFSRYKLV